MVELQFVGAIERLRLEVAASGTLASAQRPGAPTLSIEASRTAPEVEMLPLAVGQEVFVGFKRMHTLPTPISSLRIVGGPARTARQLAAVPIVRELIGAHAHRAAATTTRSTSAASKCAACRF